MSILSERAFKLFRKHRLIPPGAFVRSSRMKKVRGAKNHVNNQMLNMWKHSIT